MRSWFTFIVTVIVILAVLVLIFVVSFVLSNRQMFEAKFDIIIPLQFLGWSHTWEGVQFIYIITGCILLGALIITITTFGLDAKRTLALRSLRKEVKRLQEALEKAQPLQAAPEPEVQEQFAEGPKEAVEFTDSSAVTPEDITKSFEDTIQKDSFLRETQPSVLEEQDHVKLESSSAQIESTSVLVSSTSEVGNEPGEAEQTPVEAEIIEGAENLPRKEEDLKAPLKEEDEGNKA